MMGLRVTGSCLMKRMVGLVSSRGGVFMKSCRSLPAVKHVFEPQSNSTRTAGSDSARLNASTRPVYRAAVSGIFFLRTLDADLRHAAARLIANLFVADLFVHLLASPIGLGTVRPLIVWPLNF